jgi:hypothetical protein
MILLLLPLTVAAVIAAIALAVLAHARRVTR